MFTDMRRVEHVIMARETHRAYAQRYADGPIMNAIDQWLDAELRHNLLYTVARSARLPVGYVDFVRRRIDARRTLEGIYYDTP